MTANDIPTAGFVDDWFRVVLALLRQLQPAPVPAQAEVVLYSKQQLAAVLGVDVDTVGRWLHKGKTGRDGRLLKLQAFKFTSEPRIPWPALLAYERGEAFDLATLPAPLLAPPPVVEPAPIPPLSKPSGPPHLRVA